MDERPITGKEVESAIGAMTVTDDYRPIIAMQTRLMLEMRNLLSDINIRLAEVERKVTGR